jgi:hypothetical protein
MEDFEKPRIAVFKTKILTKSTVKIVKYDIIYISCVFTKDSRAKKRLAKRLAPIAEVHIGGIGVDLKTTLPDAIKKLEL